MVWPSLMHWSLQTVEVVHLCNQTPPRCSAQALIMISTVALIKGDQLRACWDKKRLYHLICPGTRDENRPTPASFLIDFRSHYPECLNGSRFCDTFNGSEVLLLRKTPQVLPFVRIGYCLNCVNPWCYTYTYSIYHL